MLFDHNFLDLGSNGISPDDDLRQRIVTYLVSRQIPGAKSLAIRAENGVVTVAGKLESFYYKQLCTHACRRVAGVLDLVDEIEVTRRAPQGVQALAK